MSFLPVDMMCMKLCLLSHEGRAKRQHADPEAVETELFSSRLVL